MKCRIFQCLSLSRSVGSLGLKCVARQITAKKDSTVSWICRNSAMEAPRVNAQMLTNLTGKLVCLVGRVSEIAPSGSELKIETSDHRVVNVVLSEQLEEPLEGVIEVIGKVERGPSLFGQRIVPYGKDFNLDQYDEAVQLATNFPEYGFA